MRLCLKEMIPIAKKRKNGEGTLRLRKDGRWEGRVVIDYNEKGQPITKCVTAKTKTECSAKLEKLKEQYGRSSDRIKADMPFGGLDRLLVSDLLPTHTPYYHKNRL